MTNLDRIVIYVETSIHVLLHRDLTFGPCVIRFLGRDRGCEQTRSSVSEWTASDQMRSVLMTSVNKRVENRNPFLPTLLHYTLFNDSKIPPFSIFSASHSSWLTVRRKQNLLVVKAQGRVLFTSLISKDPGSFQLSTPATWFQRHAEKDSCATVWGCKHCGSRYTCLQTNIMSWRECLSAVKRGFPHNGFFGATRQWLICTSKVMQQN